MPWASLSLIGQPMVTSRQWKLAYLLSPLEQHFRGTRKWSRFDQLSCPVPSRPILSSPVQSHPNITQFIPSKPIPPSTLSIKWNISLLLAYRKACCHHLAKSWICMYFKTRLVYLEKFYKTYLRFINSLIHAQRELKVVRLTAKLGSTPMRNLKTLLCFWSSFCFLETLMLNS